LVRPSADHEIGEFDPLQLVQIVGRLHHLLWSWLGTRKSSEAGMERRNGLSVWSGHAV
jgi:hypothetical protein